MPWHSQPVDIIDPTTKTANAATIADHNNRLLSSSFFSDDTYNSAGAAKEVTLAPHAHTPALVKGTILRGRAIDFIDKNATRASIHLARVVVDVISNQRFHILLKNLLNNRYNCQSP